MLTTKMRFYSDLVNYSHPRVGSIFSFMPAVGVLSLKDCEPTVEGTWAGEGSGALEERVLPVPSLAEARNTQEAQHTQDASWMGLSRP